MKKSCLCNFELMGIGVPEEWVNVWAMFVGGKKWKERKTGVDKGVWNIWELRCVLCIHEWDISEARDWFIYADIPLYEMGYIGIGANWLKYAQQAFNFFWQTSISSKSKSSVLFITCSVLCSSSFFGGGFLSATQNWDTQLCCTRFSISLLLSWGMTDIEEKGK